MNVRIRHWPVSIYDWVPDQFFTFLIIFYLSAHFRVWELRLISDQAAIVITPGIITQMCHNNRLFRHASIKHPKYRIWFWGRLLPEFKPSLLFLFLYKIVLHLSWSRWWSWSLCSKLRAINGDSRSDAKYYNIVRGENY